MTLRRGSGPASAVKIVRRRLADGTVKEYRYDRSVPCAKYAARSIGALILAYERSPEYAALASASRSTYTLYMRPLGGLRDVPATDVRRRALLTIRDAIAETRGRGAATGFVRACKALFSWARERDWIESSPAAEMRPLSGGHLPAWTQQQADHALAALPEHLRRVVLLAMHTGQRRGDLIALQWSAYDGQAIRLRQQKTGVALVVPVSSVLRRELDVWRKAATSTRILTQADGRPWNATVLSHALPTALQRAGLPAGLNVHGLRKLAATRYAEAGCSMSEIAAITGHRSLSMVQLYTASADQERLAGAAIVRLENGGRKTTEITQKKRAKTCVPSTS